ncbi:TatD family hydrolase [Neptunicella marina]|uniref:TatD family hydrolase n=1 Tax=Neptunicella marina TaxID=2125989 RepID=A0A8J6IWA9_9ALTE|nr:TatD family hydrolase [Neptunicella marina]MBC3766890.1 TatD family hydrolase [Neptunicella marina]
MFDSHCHLDFAVFDTDREQLMERAIKQGLTGLIIPGTQAQRWQQQIQLCEQLNQQFSPDFNCYFALGLHPYFAKPESLAQLTELETALQQYKSNVVALGEIGLDQAIEVPVNLQTQLFSEQLQLAKQFKLPVILHHRKSHHLLMQHIKARQFNYGGIIHAFSGSYQQAKAYIDEGFMLGIGGTITYPRAAKTRETVTKLPLDVLVLETDAPDMPINGRQGQRNSPEYLINIAKSLAELQNRSVENVIELTSENVGRALRLN